MNFKVTMGLPKQEGIHDLNAMREAIQRGARDSSLIHNCLMAAQHQGFSDEDKYVLLAFHALQMLEDFWQKNLEAAYLNAGPFVVKNPAPDAAAPAVPSGIYGAAEVKR